MSFAKSLAQKLAVALFLSLPLAGSVVGCSVDSTADESDDLTSSTVTFKKLSITKANASPALTILKSKAQFQAFFGKPAPSSIDFNKSWILHYSTGMQNTGGFKAEIVSIKRSGSGASRKLDIVTRATSPGPACIVTESLTNPQMTVKINKQVSSIGINQENDDVVTDCSEPDFCATALCPSGLVCSEATDSCIQTPFCWIAKCPNGTTCDDTARACVPSACDSADEASCPSGFECRNQIQCIQAPCPEDYRCISLTP